MKSASEALHQILVEGLGRLVGEGKLPAEPIPAVFLFLLVITVVMFFTQ